MSISQLELDQNRNKKSLLPHVGFIEPRLPIRDLNRLDAIPPYDPAAANTTSGQSLRSIMQVIERARIGYVGIVATDSRDVVFLAKLLRNECPNVSVFTIEPSIALLHPEDARELRGMLVSSTYPLTTMVQYWTKREKEAVPMIPFPTQGSQGYYNAILAQFGEKALLGYRVPKIRDNIPSEVPPIWISRVSQGGKLMPVHYYLPEQQQIIDIPPIKPNQTTIVSCPDTCDEVPDTNHDNSAQKDAIVSVTFGSMFGIFLSIAMLGSVIASLLANWIWYKLVGIELSNKEIMQSDSTFSRVPDCWLWYWRVVIFCGMLLFTLPYCIPGLEIFYPCTRIANGEHWIVFLSSVFLNLEVVVLVVLLLGRSIGWRLLGANPEPSFTGYRILLCLTVGAILSLVFWWFNQSPIERFFFLVRSSDFSAGMSPILTMSLLGVSVMLFGWYRLSQLIQWQASETARLPFPYPDSATGIKQANDRLIQSCSSPIHLLYNSVRSFIPIGLMIIFLVFVLLNLRFALATGETPIWDYLIRGIFILLSFAILITLFNLIQIWGSISNLTQEILRVPMVSAFEDLPMEIRRLYGGYLFSQRPRSKQLETLFWTLQPTERKSLNSLSVSQDESAKEQTAVSHQPTLTIDHISPTQLRDRAYHYIEKIYDHSMHLDGEQIYGSDRSSNVESSRSEGKFEKSKPPAKQLYPPEWQFVASYVALYLAGFFSQLRMLVYASITAAPLLLVAAASYPFQPDQRPLMAFFTMLILVVLTIIYLLYSMNKNELLSRITHTTPGRFSMDSGFFSSMFTYVVPLLALIVLQLLGLFRFIIEPILNLFD